MNNYTEFIKYYLDRDFDGILKKSYFHNNGFYKIVLYENSQVQIRLHIWFKPMVMNENIHNHRFSFVTNLICGSYEEKLYEIDEEGALFYTYKYIQNSLNEYHLVPAKSLRLKEVERNIFSSHNVVFRSPQVLHRIHPLTDTVATLFIATGNFYDDCIVLNETPLKSTEIITTALNSKELITVIKDGLGITLKKR